MLQSVVVYCSVLQCVAVCCSLLQFVAMCCSMLKGVTMCCDMSQCCALYCSVLRCVACVTMPFIILQRVLYTVARHVARHVACHVARHVAKPDVADHLVFRAARLQHWLQHAGLHAPDVLRCYTLLSHAATPCNTLQLTATHCRRAPLALSGSPCSFHHFLLLFSRKHRSLLCSS